MTWYSDTNLTSQFNQISFSHTSTYKFFGILVTMVRIELVACMEYLPQKVKMAVSYLVKKKGMRKDEI